MPKIQPNPSVPIRVDPLTGELEVPIDSASGVAVVAEVSASGNLYEVPAGKTFTGIAVLIVGTGSGLVQIEDGSSAAIHSAGGADGLAAGVAIASVPGQAGGGGGNQLAVVLGASSQLISAVVAGYVK